MPGVRRYTRPKTPQLIRSSTMIIDWISANVENIVKVGSVIETAGVTLYQIKTNLPGSRAPQVRP